MRWDSLSPALLLVALGIAPLQAQQPADSAGAVPIGYGTVGATEVTGAVTRLSPADFNTGRSVSLRQLIRGRIAGVQVADADEPGVAAPIRIRGGSTLEGADPLFVVDGVPLGPGGGPTAGRDPLDFLDPSDIASITILRDGAAAAIYGGDGSNGVVLIETKGGAGARQGPLLEYSGSVSSSAVARAPAVLSAAEFREAVATYAPSRSALLGSANTDWFRAIDRTAPGQQHDLAVSSAGSTGSFRLSVGYLRQEGVVRRSGIERTSLALRADQRLFDDRLDLHASLRGARIDDAFQAADVLPNAVLMAPTQPVRDSTSATGYWDWPAGGFPASNPVASLDRSTDRATTWRGLGSARVGYRMPFLEALRADVQLGFDVEQGDHRRFAPNDLADQIVYGHGLLETVTGNSSGSLLQGWLTYAAPLRALPGAVRVTAGYVSQRSHTEALTMQALGLSTNLLGVNGIPTATVVTNQKVVADDRLTSVFGRAAWSLGDRWVVTASVRRDRVSAFAPGLRGSTFPAVAALWHISRESFLRPFAAHGDLTLRLSWGRTGNRWSAQHLPVVAGPFSVDPNLHWERTGSWDAGFDAAVAGERLRVSFDWYSRTTSGAIAVVPVCAGCLFSSYVMANVGSVRNRGVEVSVRALVLRPGAHALGWTAEFVVSHNANVLTAFDPAITASGRVYILAGAITGGVGNTVQVLMPGQPVGAFLVYQQKYDAAGKPLEGQYADLNGDGVLNNLDTRPFHSPWPSLEVGHRSRFTFHRWDLGVSVRASLGNYVYDNVASQASWQALTGGSSPSNVPTSVLRSGFSSPQYFSDYFVEDASFLRVDAVTLGYTIGSRGARLRIFAGVQDAATITGYRGVDAGAAPGGIDANLYPRAHTFVAGLDFGP